MRAKSLWILAVASAAFVSALFYLQPKPAPKPPAMPLWLPQLDVGQVTALVIARPGQPEIRVERRDSGWFVASLQQFPAAPAGIVKLLRALTEARTLEAQSSAPQHRAALGLDEQASRLTLERSGDQPLTLLLGKHVEHGGQVVNVLDTQATWLINSNLELPHDSLAWIDRRLTQIPLGQIRQLSLTYPNGVRVQISRSATDEKQLVVQQHPSQPPLAGEIAAHDLLGLFSQLNILGIADGADAHPMTQADLGFELLTFHEGKVTGHLSQRENQYWLKLNAVEGLSAQYVRPLMNWTLRVEASLSSQQ